MQKPINHGVIPGKKSNTFIGGTIPWENRNPSGDWHQFLVPGERQYFQGFDTMACVSFAVNNSHEIQIKQQTGQEVNFSDRFLAKMSGTTMSGNWVYIVLDTWRNIGVVNEEEWPKPPEPTTFDAYYNPIPQFIQDRAKAQSTNKFGVPVYEYISDRSPANIKKQLQHAPLLITIPGHEITGIVLSSDNVNLTVLDDYEFNQEPGNPFVRTIKLTDVVDIYKSVLTVKGDSMKLVNDGGTTYLVGPKGKIGIADPASEALMKQLDDVQVGSTAGIVQKGTMSHDDAFIIHK